MSLTPSIGISSVNNVPLQLKNNVNKQEFRQNVDQALQGNKLNKEQYKSIKDSMVNGRQSINEVLSQVGVASKDDLGKIFARKRNDGSVEINSLQKNMIKSIISDKAPLSEAAQKHIDDIKKEINPPQDRSDLKNRYSLDDCIFNPKINHALKEHCKKELCEENFNFLNDVKTTIQNPDKETLKSLYDQYIKSGSTNEVNVSYQNRLHAKQVFENPNSSVENMLGAVKGSFFEVKGVLSRDTYPRFKRDGIKNAMKTDAMELQGKERQNYFNNFIGGKFDMGAKAAIKQEADIVLKNLQSM